MSKYIRRSDQVDVMLLAEGTYPYIRGGVSSWIAQLLTGLPNIKFGICFIGSQESEYGEMRYELPENLVHLEVHYMFGDDKPDVKRMKGNKKSFEAVRELHQSFKERKNDIPDMMKDINFYMKDVTFEHFLYSELSWDYINEMYLKNCPDVPFIDYFWTLRNIHRPIWTLAQITKNLPSVKLFHAPSTGYAGFLGALGSYTTGKPYILTEHGIYTRERKIDMLSAEWVNFQKPNLLKQPEEFNYIKKMWVSFFERIGEFSYKRANPILSLYPGAQKIQVAFGADESRTQVIPNGVDVDGLNATMVHRQDPPKPIITLIGRVVSIKDIKTFIRAIRITVNKIPAVEAWIVGPTDEDPEYYAECEQMVESLGLKENMKFLGFQNIKDILPQSALQTLTSISEGMPLVILEGYAAGVPCVATDVGSCRDLIYGGLDDEDIALGAAGAITNIANPSELAEQYIHYLSDYDAWKRAQNVALQRVEKYYRQEMFLQQYHDIYRDAMKEEA
ncbi:GT4 family glycosyltransferase PelF [bacterium]|nr:GT4 family glycosyltransferase PelF [bacterium]MBU1990306.1 GT4 family glycosyltransferase PelF [bacterium]